MLGDFALDNLTRLVSTPCRYACWAFVDSVQLDEQPQEPPLDLRDFGEGGHGITL
jgi:hypothetical protein